MKKILTNKFVPVAVMTVLGFVSGFFVDSVLFAINGIFCGVTEAILVGGIALSFTIKDGRL